jgi:hypothetical protein
MSLLHRQRLMPTRPAWCDLPYIQHDRQPVQARGLAPLAVSLQLGEKPPSPPGPTTTRTTRTNCGPCARSACAPTWWPGRPACLTTIAAPVRTQASGYSSCCRPSWLAQTSNCRRPWSTVAGSPTAKETSSIKSWELLQRNYLELHWIMKHLIFTNC